MAKRWVFLGKDERFRICQQLVEREGHEAVLVRNIAYMKELEELLRTFQPDVIVFPVQPLQVYPCVEAIPEQATLCLGGGGDEVFGDRVQMVKRYLQDEQFLQENAKLTAEAWVDHFYRNGYGALYGKSFIVAGYGRVGKAIGARIRQNEGDVLVVSADEGERLAAKEAGYAVLPLSSTFDVSQAYLINTIPAKWYTPEKVLPLRLFDLASFPHCLTEPTHFEYDTILPTLPGKHFPIDAAKILYQTLQRLV